MNRERIDQLLKQVSETANVTIGINALSSVGEVFQAAFGAQSFIVVADENTYEAAGRFVHQQLSAKYPAVEPYIFPGKPVLHADFEHVLELESALRRHNAIQAVLCPFADRQESGPQRLHR